MSLVQRLREIRQRADSLSSHEFPPEIAEEANRYAAEAYRSCVAWYGPPKYPKRPYKLEQTPGGSMLCHWPGENHLLISDKLTSPEELCYVIAHEMYHHVTAGRKGLAGEVWIEEMMATLTSYWFCRHQGFKGYTEDIKKRWLAAEGQADVSLLRRSKRNWRRWLLYGEDKYSAVFTVSLVRVGYALLWIVERNDICRLSQAKTLEAWIASLPREKQYGVSRLLELATDGKTVPESELELGKLFHALEDKGDKNALVAEFKQIVRLQPANSYAFFYLGYAHHLAKEPDAALDAYQKAKGLGYSDKWLVYNIGSVYSQMKNYSLAAEWYQKAIDQAPDWAHTYYYLGCALNNLGNIGAARQAWEKTLTLGDEHYAKLAQKALQEKPLPPADICPGTG